MFVPSAKPFLSKIRELNCVLSTYKSSYNTKHILFVLVHFLQFKKFSLVILFIY